ncbi:MAG: hypothetical protein HY074_19540 [Deltaproteobacteria bacterium]|nr:hypothetical protein [Deltaproteobacteria bacterium]
MTIELDQKEAEAFAKYLESRKVLIADPSTSSRSGLFAVFRDLGARSNLTLLVNTFSQAQATIVSDKPHIVVAEYDLGKRCGLELLQSQREQRPEETKECLFVVVTSNTSQTAVARSAEEDIDAYIIKPFTPEVVRRTLMRAALEKIKPRDYVLAIDAGKAAMGEAKLDEAEGHFNRAMPLDPSPSLACYYLGQVKALRDIINEAQGSYQKGLSYNRIHYKCMVGLYDLLMKQQEHTQAYEIVRRLSQYFPANPKRLAEVLRLAIVTGKFEDIERYYTIFTNIDDRDETLIRYVCAALVVCGKYYLSTKVGNNRAIELFRKASVTAQGRTKVLKEIVLALLDYHLIKEADSFLSKFPPESFNSDEFLLLRFLVYNHAGKASIIIDQGRALLSRGVVDDRLYAVMIQRSAEADLVVAAEELVYEGSEKFPEKRGIFEEVLNKARKG